MIRIEHLKKSFDGKNLILDDINLTVNKGESVVLIGGSGCGKSTLLRCIDKLIEPTEGNIYFKDKNIMDKDFDLNEYRRKVGMVYQHFNLFSHLNVLENLIITPVKVLKMNQDEAIEKAKTLLKKVGMEKSIYKMPDSLSGGQKQRVSIARTLMMDPEVILFDEPTSALDPTMVDEVELVIRNLINEGLTCIIVTHEMRFAKSIGSKIIFLAEKHIYEEGTPSEIFDTPDKPLTRQFIYRSRMLEKIFNKDESDLYAFGSEINKFLSPYGLTIKQKHTVESILEEIVYPIINNDEDDIDNLRVSVFASDTGMNHRLVLDIDDKDVDILKQNCIDEIGLTIVRNNAINIIESINEYERHTVCIEF